MNFERAFLDGFIKAAVQLGGKPGGGLAVKPPAPPAAPPGIKPAPAPTMPKPAAPMPLRPAATSNAGMNAVQPAKPAQPLPSARMQSWANPQAQPAANSAPQQPSIPPNYAPAASASFQSGIQNSPPIMDWSNFSQASRNQQSAADLGSGLSGTQPNDIDSMARRGELASSMWKDPGAITTEGSGYNSAPQDAQNAALSKSVANDHGAVESAFYKAMGSGEAMPEGFMRGANNQAVEIPQAAYSNPDPAGRGAQLDQEIRQMSSAPKPAPITPTETPGWTPSAAEQLANRQGIKMNQPVW